MGSRKSQVVLIDSNRDGKLNEKKWVKHCVTVKFFNSGSEISEMVEWDIERK